MFDKRQSELTNLNVAMSNRSFNEELHGTIMSINGPEIAVNFKKMKGQPIRFDVNKWQHATIEFKTGAKKGEEVQITASSAYSSESMRDINITMAEAFPTLYAGATVRIKWVIKNTPAWWWQRNCHNLDISRAEPGGGDFPEGVGTLYFFTMWGGNASNNKLPAGCYYKNMKGEELTPKHYKDIDDGAGGLEQHEVDPETLESLGVVANG